MNSQSIVLAFLSGLAVAMGAEFHPISSVTSPTGASDLWPASNLSQGPGAGFASDEPHAQLGSGASHRWVTDAPGGFPSDYINETGTPVLVFDLGEERALSEISVWGYTTTNANGVSRFSLRFANSVEGDGNFGASIDYHPFFDCVIDDGPRQSFEFEQVIVARYVEFTCEDNFYANGGSGPPGGGDRVGLGEVAFEDAVPNPNPILEVGAALDFGNPESYPGSTTLSLTVANLGGDHALQITAVKVLPNATGSQYFAVEEAPVTVAANASAELAIAFDSAGREGCFSAILELESNDPANPRVTVLLLAGLNCIPPEPEQPTFSVEGGTFEDGFELELTTATLGAQIVFTTDGSLPSTANGTTYFEPLSISSTTQIRAATISGLHDPAVGTESYVRLAPDLAGYQSGLPILIIENFGAGTIPNKGWSTSTQTGGGLIQPERQPAFLSVIARDSLTGSASISAAPETDSRIGIRVRGAFSSTWNPKPYSLETWKQNGDVDRKVSLLGLPKDSDWILYYPHPSYDRTMLYNTFIWELSRETGRYGTRFRFVDVFVNEDGGDLRASDHRGIYALGEKVDRGRDRLDFEALNADGASGGWLLGINRMDPVPVSGYPTENGAASPQFFHTAGPNRIQQTSPNAAGQGDDIPRQYNAFINFEDPNGYRMTRTQRRAIENWFREFEDVFYDDALWRDPVNGYRKYVDTRDFIDYFHLLNLARQGDGLLLSIFPWVSSGERKLHMGPMWDFNNGAYGGNATSTLFFRSDRLWYPRLFDDPDYLREHIDRWYALRRGPLADDNMIAILDRQRAGIPQELVSAQGLSAASWTNRLNSMKSFLTRRAAWIDSQFFEPPQFSSAGGVVGSPFTLSMRKPLNGSGTIFYTLDGSDPRAPDGLAAPGAVPYLGSFALPRSVHVQARILSTAGEWSAVNEATFVVGTPADSTNLVISELMYHPADPDAEGEFLELLNIAEEPIDLTGVSFTDGIEFTFPAEVILAPGERVLLVANQNVFELLHGPGLRIAGQFENRTRLENAGERIVLSGADLSPIHNFEYDDRLPWPRASDGLGFSLVLLDPHSNPDHSNASNWRRSGAVGGQPGRSDSTQFEGDPHADLDGDGRNALLEYVYGTSDLDPLDRVHGLRVAVDQFGALSVSFPHDASADEAVTIIEISADLQLWVPATTIGEREVELGALPIETWQLAPSLSEARFIRLRVMTAP